MQIHVNGQDLLRELGDFDKNQMSMNSNDDEAKETTVVLVDGYYDGCQVVVVVDGGNAMAGDRRNNVLFPFLCQIQNFPYKK